MKARKLLLSVFACMIVAMVIIACNKKDNGGGSTPAPTPTQPPADYGFVIGGSNSTYVNAEKPESTLDYIPTVNMNNQALAGGANYITIDSEISASKIIVANAGKEGYIEIIPTKASQDLKVIEYDFFIIVNQEQEGDVLNLVFAIVDENGNVSGYDEAHVEIIENGTGTLQVSLSFDTSKDVDLHLIEPNGSHIYYGDPNSNNGGCLDVDSNAGCYIDNINNENIFYGEDANVEPGLYTVYVDMWENCDESLPTNFVLTVFYNGQLLINPIAGHFPADEPSNGGNLQDIQPVCTFRIPDNGKQSSTKFVQTNRPKFLRSLDKMQ